MPAPGTPMPDFELPNQDGQMVRLSSLRGRKVILFAFPRADTPGCTTQACGFRDETPRLTTGNAVVFGISADTPDELRKWKAKINLPYDLLSDADHAVLEQLGAWGEKKMFGKASMGIIRSHWVIDEQGSVIEEKIKVSPEDSVAMALRAVGG